MIRAWRKHIRTGLFLLGLAFILWILADSRHAVAGYLESVDVPALLFSLAMSLAYYAFATVIYLQLLRKYGFNGGYRLVRDLFFYGQFAKYIPGKVWTVVYHAAALQVPSAGSVVVFANLDFFIAVILGVAGLSFGIVLWKTCFFCAAAVYAVGLAAGAWVIQSGLILKAARRFFKGLGPSSEALRAASAVSFATAFFYMAVITVLYFIMNAVFMYAVFGLPVTGAADYIAYLGIGWILGVALFVVPAGVGVREGVFVFLAQWWGQDVSSATVGAMAVLLRLWQVVQDVAGAGLVFGLNRWERRDR